MIISSLNHVILVHKLARSPIEAEICWEKLIIVEFPDVIYLLKDFYKKKIIFLIDENDQPIINQFLRIIETSLTEEKETDIEMTIMHMRMFYSKIKDLSVENVQLTVITGHSMISQSALYSGFTKNEIKYFFL